MSTDVLKLSTPARQILPLLNAPAIKAYIHAENSVGVAGVVWHFSPIPTVRYLRTVENVGAPIIFRCLATTYSEFLNYFKMD